MTERLLGTYRLLKELGSGGMGTVFLAEALAGAAGVEEGRQVAVKLVHHQLVSTPGFFKRFMREAEVGKRIRHENVVRTLDVDATDFEGRTVLFLVMEYVEGGTLRQVLQELGRVPEALLREIALQVSAGLVAIHGEGVVHRDLKPENVLITNDNRVRIMDLGVAKLQEASVAITREGQFAGSFLYAAPEQFRNGEVGPPVDLYSLGVMLYELATGQNPFRADDAAGVIHAHLSRRPPRASELNPDTSEFSAEVMSTLLAKSPADRFDSAQALHGLLQEGETSAWWHEREGRLRRREVLLPAIQVRRETEVHGREKELALLAAAWERAKEGDGSVLLIEGEAGIGKTRLVDAFLQGVGSENVHVLYGSYPPSGGLGGISDAIVAKFGDAGLQSALAPYLTVTPSLVPAFTALIRHESLPTAVEPLQGDALNAVCCHLAHALAAEQPTVWVVDDLNFAPEESRNLVLSLARSVRSHRILLVVTSRAGLPDEYLAHLGRLPNFKRVGLGRLGAREIVELLTDAFKSKSLAQKLGGKIGYKSDGVPFFIFEIVRGLKEGQHLSQQPDGTYVQSHAITDIEVPSAVRDLIEARLRGLTEEERNLIDVAAACGYEFDPDLVARVCEVKRVKVLQKLAALERQPGIVRASGTSYRFDHNQIHELVYGALSPGLRQEYHGLLAEAMAEREGLRPESATAADGESVCFLVSHGLRGSSPRGALRYLPRAMDHLRGSYRSAAAAELADIALAVPFLLEGRERVELLLNKSKCFGGRERRESVEEALPAAEATGDLALLARTHAELGSGLTSIAQYADARRHLEKALEIARSLGDPGLEPHTPLGSLAWYLGEYEEARQHFAAALEIARQSNVPEQMLNPTWGLGLCLWNLGRWRESREQLELLLQGARKHGNRTALCGALDNLGPLHAALGDTVRARQVLEESGPLARGRGDRSSSGFVLHRLGRLAEQEGKLDEAERLYTESLALRREIHHLSGAVDSLIGLGCLALAREEWKKAREHLEQGRDLAKEVGLSGMAAFATVFLALVPGGDAAAAGDALAAHESRLDVRARMEARYAMWRVSGDRAHIAEAHRLVCFVRDHAPEECRVAMIEKVPLHREIVAAFGAE